MKAELKIVLNQLNPSVLGVETTSIRSVKKLGVGEGNLNYLVKMHDKQFVCRINIDKGVPNKSKNEFDALRRIERLNIAPKPFYYHPKDNTFPYGFIILEYVEGKPLRKKKRSYTQKQVKHIACLLGELHSNSCGVLPKNECSTRQYLKQCQEYITTINTYDNTQKKEFAEIQNKIRQVVPKKEWLTRTLIHGDVCPQNIVETKKGLHLIDWESLQCSDPAKDIANVLIDVNLTESDVAVFLKEYHKKRKDPTILERAKTYAVFLRTTYFLWEITRCFEIMNKVLPKEYLSNTTVQRHSNEAKYQFRKLSELLDVPNINIDSLCTQNKN